MVLSGDTSLEMSEKFTPRRARGGCWKRGCRLVVFLVRGSADAWRDGVVCLCQFFVRSFCD